VILGITPWKILPIVLLIGYILIQLIRRYQFSRELADLKQLNEQLQALNTGIQSSDNKIEKNGHLDTPKFILSYKGDNLHLNPELIIRIESNENYCHVLVAPNESQNGYCYMARMTLKEAISQLPGSVFVQVHRSHVVNSTYISNLVRKGRNYQLRLTNGDEIPISRSRIKHVRQKFPE